VVDAEVEVQPAGDAAGEVEVGLVVLDHVLAHERGVVRLDLQALLLGDLADDLAELLLQERAGLAAARELVQAIEGAQATKTRGWFSATLTCVPTISPSKTFCGDWPVVAEADLDLGARPEIFARVVGRRLLGVVVELEFTTARAPAGADRRRSAGGGRRPPATTPCR
jgi:hypothetical protein